MSWTLADQPVLSGSLTWPATGAWTCRLVLAADEAPSGLVQLQLGTLALTGTVAEAGLFGGRCTARVNAGQGHLQDHLEGQHYLGATGLLIAQALCAGVGEQLDSESASALEAFLPHWHHFGGTLARALSDLATELGCAWWITPAGLVRFGTPTYAAAEPEGATVLDERSDRRTLVVALDEEPLLPGTTFRGRRLSAVDHELSPRRWQASARWAA